MRHGIAAILFFIIFYTVAAFGSAGKGCPLASKFPSALTSTDTTKKDKPKKINGCTVIGNLTGTTCIGSTLTATATEPIASVEWIFENGTSLAKQTTTPFTYTGDVAGTYYVKIITVGGCVVNSNSVTITNLKEPLIVISTRSNVVCADYPDPVFNAAPTYNGEFPSYQWKVNGINSGPPRTTLAPFSPTGLKKGDRVTCEMTSSDNCITTPVVESAPIIIDDIPVENPAVTLALNTATPCEGTPLMFTATPINAGDAPAYQWYVNNTAVTGALASTFTSATLKDGDLVTCSVVSNAKICQVSPVGISQPLVVQHIPLVMPEVSIAASTTVATIGTAIIFTASIKNGGTNPQYLWKVNGAEAGTGNAVFTSPTFKNGDQVTCTLISNADCTASNTVTSAAVTVQINIPVVASSPNVFTPNGDGVNDTWSFPGQQAYPDARLKIYNRNGQMVFHAMGNAGAWAGADDSGAACPGGVYYYLVNLAAGKVISGAVTIIR